MKLLQRLRDNYLSVSANYSRRAMKVYDYCPHCGEKTPWMVRVVTGFFRCLQCGHNPLDHDAAPHARQHLVAHDDADVTKRVSA